MRDSFLLVLLLSIASVAAAQPVNWKKVRILVYTKNGKGYVHENIPFAVSAIQKLGRENGFTVDVTDDPAVFTDSKLAVYSFLMFPSTNQDVFDTHEQRLAFRRYIESGGGFVGLHSAIGTERSWTWFKQMLGGSFAWHPTFQKYTVRVIDAEHPCMKGIPAAWERSDECYFVKEMYPGIRPVMAQDIATLDPKDSVRVKSSLGPYSTLYPAAWYQHFDGGTVWITALGHDKTDYVDPIFLKHIFNGMTWVASQTKGLDRSKAYATDRDDPLKVLAPKP